MTKDTTKDIDVLTRRINNCSGLDPVAVARAIGIPDCFAGQRRSVLRARGQFIVSVPGQEFCAPLGRSLYEANELLDSLGL